jgi:hypothetical protein
MWQKTIIDLLPWTIHHFLLFKSIQNGSELGTVFIMFVKKECRLWEGCMLHLHYFLSTDDNIVYKIEMCHHICIHNLYILSIWHLNLLHDQILALLSNRTYIFTETTHCPTWHTSHNVCWIRVFQQFDTEVSYDATLHPQMVVYVQTLYNGMLV